MSVTPLSLPATSQADAPQALTKVEVRHFWEVAYYAQHGFSLKFCPRGNRAYMVRRA